MAENGYVEKLEACKQESKDGSAYWMARDLQELLGYDKWSNFATAITRAMESCASAGVEVSDQFAETSKMVNIGSGAKRETDDWFLSRYACYLIAMNGDTTKPEVGAAQAYFAVQTRKQEIIAELTPIEHRAHLRDRVTQAQKILMDAAKNAGVQKYAVFTDAGYKGLYGGLGVPEIKAKKNIPTADALLDCIGREELAMNEFHKTQAEAKLKRDGVKNEAVAIRTNNQVASEVRSAVAKLGGTMPEDLPAEPNINKLLTPKQRKRIKELGDDFAAGQKLLK